MIEGGTLALDHMSAGLQMLQLTMAVLPSLGHPQCTHLCLPDSERRAYNDSLRRVGYFPTNRAPGCDQFRFTPAFLQEGNSYSLRVMHLLMTFLSEKNYFIRLSCFRQSVELRVRC
jgi:hypothetical protein